MTNNKNPPKPYKNTYKDFQTYYSNQVDYYHIKPKTQVTSHISYETYITKSYNTTY